MILLAETKREAPLAPPGDDGDEDREDEQPTVVVLADKGLSEEDYQQFRRKQQEESGYPSDVPALFIKERERDFIG